MESTLPADKDDRLPTEVAFLTRAEFHKLAEVPPEAEWFANLDNPNTRRAYRKRRGRLHSVCCH